MVYLTAIQLAMYVRHTAGFWLVYFCMYTIIQKYIYSLLDMDECLLNGLPWCMQLSGQTISYKLEIIQLHIVNQLVS